MNDSEQFFKVGYTTVSAYEYDSYIINVVVSRDQRLGTVKILKCTFFDSTKLAINLYTIADSTWLHHCNSKHNKVMFYHLFC